MRRLITSSITVIYFRYSGHIAHRDGSKETLKMTVVNDRRISVPVRLSCSRYTLSGQSSLGWELTVTRTLAMLRNFSWRLTIK